SQNQRRFSCQRGDSPIASPVNNVLTSIDEDFVMLWFLRVASCRCRAPSLLNSSFFLCQRFPSIRLSFRRDRERKSHVFRHSVPASASAVYPPLSTQMSRFVPELH